MSGLVLAHTNKFNLKKEKKTAKLLIVRCFSVYLYSELQITD